MLQLLQPPSCKLQVARLVLVLGPGLGLGLVLGLVLELLMRRTTAVPTVLATAGLQQHTLLRGTRLARHCSLRAAWW